MQFICLAGYRDVWSCLTYFWVQVFSQNNFADVQGKVSIFREGLLLEEVQLPTTADSFWVGFVLELWIDLVGFARNVRRKQIRIKHIFNCFREWGTIQISFTMSHLPKTIKKQRFYYFPGA